MNATVRKKIKNIINVLENYRDELTKISDEEQDAFDNRSENFQDSDKGQKCQELIDSLDNTYSELESVIEQLEEII